MDNLLCENSQELSMICDHQDLLVVPLKDVTSMKQRIKCPTDQPLLAGQLFPVRKPLLTKRSRRCPKRGCGRYVIRPQINPCSNPPFQKLNIAMWYLPRIFLLPPNQPISGKDYVFQFTVVNPIDQPTGVTFSPVNESTVPHPTVKIATEAFTTDLAPFNDLLDVHEVYGEEEPQPEADDDPEVIPHRKWNKILVRMKGSVVEHTAGKIATATVSCEYSIIDKAERTHMVPCQMVFTFGVIGKNEEEAPCEEEDVTAEPPLTRPQLRSYVPITVNVPMAKIEKEMSVDGQREAERDRAYMEQREEVRVRVEKTVETPVEEEKAEGKQEPEDNEKGAFIHRVVEYEGDYMPTLAIDGKSLAASDAQNEDVGQEQAGQGKGDSETQNTIGEAEAKNETGAEERTLKDPEVEESVSGLEAKDNHQSAVEIKPETEASTDKAAEIKPETDEAAEIKPETEEEGAKIKPETEEETAEIKAETEASTDEAAKIKAETEPSTEEAAKIKPETEEETAKIKAETEASTEEAAKIKAETEASTEEAAKTKAETEPSTNEAAQIKPEAEASTEEAAKIKSETEPSTEAVDAKQGLKLNLEGISKPSDKNAPAAEDKDAVEQNDPENKTQFKSLDEEGNIPHDLPTISEQNESLVNSIDTASSNTPRKTAPKAKAKGATTPRTPRTPPTPVTPKTPASAKSASTPKSVTTPRKMGSSTKVGSVQAKAPSATPGGAPKRALSKSTSFKK
eukprot:Platyproteum_vivax@DN7497_c0_g1_i1.p1